MEKLNKEKTEKPYKFYIITQSKTADGFRMKSPKNMFDNFKKIRPPQHRVIDRWMSVF